MNHVPVASSSGTRPMRRAMPLAIGLCVGLLASQVQAAVLLSDDFESGTTANWTVNSAGVEWSVASETGNQFYRRVAATTSWGDNYGTTTYTDVSVEAWVRINNWNASTQNRTYLMARVNGTPSSTSTLRGYLVSIAPDSTITIEKRGDNKAMTTLAIGHGQDILGANWYVGNWTKVRLEVSGTTTAKISIYVNGVQVATAQDSSSPYTSGLAGFGSAGSDADFDDVTVDDTIRGKESDQASLLKSPLPHTPQRHIAANTAVILASARASKAGV